MKIKDGTYLNGAVWVAGEPMALDLNPGLKRGPLEILKEHVEDQRRYICRLQERVEKIDEFLNKNS